jgi:hypothetical protein
MPVCLLAISPRHDHPSLVSPAQATRRPCACKVARLSLRGWLAPCSGAAAGLVMRCASHEGGGRPSVERECQASSSGNWNRTGSREHTHSSSAIRSSYSHLPRQHEVQHLPIGLIFLDSSPLGVRTRVELPYVHWACPYGSWRPSRWRVVLIAPSTLAAVFNCSNLSRRCACRWLISPVTPLPSQRQKAPPFRAGDECRLARRRACDVLHFLTAPCQLNAVCRFQAKSFAWVKAATCLGRSARSSSGSSACHLCRVERSQCSGCGATQRRCKTVEAPSL